jgi:hypothetical protein
MMSVMGMLREGGLPAGFVPAQGAGLDYLSRDGKTAIHVPRSMLGSRDLHAAVMQLGISLADHPGVERGLLVVTGSRMALASVREGWAAARHALRRPIADRLGLVVVAAEESWVDPEDPRLRSVARHFERTTGHGRQQTKAKVSLPPGRKLYEVVKVLLSRWLRREGPIQISAIASLVGCSYPTVRRALDKATVRPALSFQSNRSVELKSFPHDAWRELVALTGTLRGSMRFCDRSGEKPAPQALLARLERAIPPHVGVGGVVAARHWDPDFNLHGMPRLDLVCHAPDGTVDLGFVEKLDPSLSLTKDPSEPAVLVIHPLVRSAPLFSAHGRRLPWADPVETALDLCELSLGPQANRLLSALRPEVRLS